MINETLVEVSKKKNMPMTSTININKNKWRLFVSVTNYSIAEG